MALLPCHFLNLVKAMQIPRSCPMETIFYTKPVNLQCGSIWHRCSSGFITHVLDDAARPEFVNGQLLFIRGSRVFSQQFDPASGKVSGTPVPITSAGTYSATASVLVFQNQPNEARLEWFTADGQPQGTI